MKSFLRYLAVFLSVFILTLSCHDQAEASEPLSVTHSVQVYSTDGPSMTVTLNLQVQNTGTAMLNNINLTQAQLPNVSLPPSMENAPETVSVGNLSAGQSANVTYTITSHMVYPESEIGSLSIFWEISYLDELSQEVVTIIGSN